MKTNALNTAPTLRSPSRLDNPFGTCWTRPGAIPFRFTGNQNVESLIAKLKAQNGWGVIIGPHGSGKSTLLESLKPALLHAGFDLHTASLRDSERTLPRWYMDQLSSCHTKSMVIVDGYDQLFWFQRWGLRRIARRKGAGLLVTAHRSTSIPTLITLAPDRDLIEVLVRRLCTKVSTTVTPDDIAASHACHGSNVREIFFDLYDCHELRIRGSHSLTTSSQRLTRLQP